MPITCAHTFPRLSTDEFGKLDYDIMSHAFASHRELGYLADESVYQVDFGERLRAAGYDVYRELPITVSFGTYVKTYYLDIAVAAKGIYELKTTAKLTDAHSAQVMNYLLLLNSAHGKLINFRAPSVESDFVNAPLTLHQRRAFTMDTRRWRGDESTKQWMIEMLRDWGTSLEIPLYTQALIHSLGGDALVTKQLPMQRGGLPLGNQRFHLLEPDAAFRITAFNHPTTGYETQLRRLLKLSPLRSIHWINIGHQHVAFTTIT
jgi:GxxExxY protein